MREYIVKGDALFTPQQDETIREAIAFPTQRALVERREKLTYTEQEVDRLCQKAKADALREVTLKVSTELKALKDVPFPDLETAGDAYAELLEWLTGHYEVK